MTFRYFLNTYKKSDGTYNLRLKLQTTYNDVQFLSTNISLKKNQWNSKKQKIVKHQLDEKLNNRLNTFLTKIQSVYYENPDITAKELKNIINNKSKYNSNSFIEFAQSILEDFKKQERYSTYKTRSAILKNVENHFGKLSFKEITPLKIKEFERSMIKKGNSQNYISTSISFIKSTLNKAVRLKIIKFNPIIDYSVKQVNVERNSLTFDQILKIEKLEIEPKHKKLILTRDMFLFSFYCAGMRYSDVCQIQWSNIKKDEIVYVMSKSKDRYGSNRNIPLNSKLRSILKKYKSNSYIFPILQGYEKESNEVKQNIIRKNNPNVNRALRAIGKRIDLDFNLSFHIAKHSFADFAVKKDVDLLMISKLLGHTKLSTTQHYLKDFYQKKESDTITKLFGE